MDAYTLLVSIALAAGMNAIAKIALRRAITTTELEAMVNEALAYELEPGFRGARAMYKSTGALAALVMRAAKENPAMESTKTQILLECWAMRRECFFLMIKALVSKKP